MKLSTVILAIGTLVGVATIYSFTSNGEIGNVNEISEYTNSNTVLNENINILITPDLSNRITEKYSKPLCDEDIIYNIMESYYPSIYQSSGRIIGQKDKLSILLTTPKLVNNYNIKMEQLRIDLSSFNDSERIVYLTDSSKSGNTYKNDVKEFNMEINNVYQSAKKAPVGADIRNLLESQLNSNNILSDPDTINAFGKTVVTKNRNVLILITDGYMESGSNARPKNGNKCYYLSKKEVDRFRTKFLNSDETNIKVFFDKNGFGIVPVENENLKNIEIIAIEFYDRSLSKESGSSRVKPDDYDIMKLFWEDWMLKSGVKRFEVHENFSSKSESQTVINNFINGE